MVSTVFHWYMNMNQSVTTVVSVLEFIAGCSITVGTPKPRSLFARTNSKTDTDLQSPGTNTTGAVGGKWMSVHFQPGTLSPTSPTKRLSRIPSFIELVRRVAHIQYTVWPLQYCILWNTWTNFIYFHAWNEGALLNKVDPQCSHQRSVSLLCLLQTDMYPT